MWSISDLKIASPLVIGPMAGITNGAFREVCYGFGAGLTYTEMTSDKAIYYGNKKTLDML
ncbi:MAG: tRNA-dihydrouridine synthase, partial [Erysipelotrichaceae bacterium]|nr:tRNA-dihydrouridine synthase [Erysipelotrichaceae bacterium]